MDGVLLVDKPAGLTSHDVVARVRRALGGVEIGHAGTLDPFATGLLIVLVGRATKSPARASWRCRRRYETVAQLGARSSTGDPEGEITLDRAACRPTRRCCPSGEMRQRPPGTPRSRSTASAPTAARAAARSFEMPERDRHGARASGELWRRTAPPGSRAGLRFGSSAPRAPTCAR